MRKGGWYRNTAAVASLAAGLMTAGSAAAQSAPAAVATGTAAGAAPQPAVKPGAQDGRTSYDLAYFAHYAPATALQIVERVPGFAIEETNQDVRGFGQAAGNVVINGQRPSSKTDSLQTILARIPANRVQRVEVGPGELFGAEYSSKPQVLNLILSAAGGVAGTMSGSVARDFTGRLFPSGSVSALIKRGKSSFNLAGTIIQNRTTEAGPDHVYALPSGTEVERRYKVNRYRQPNGAVTGSWDYAGGENRTAHLNLRYAADRLRLHQTNDVVPAAGARRDDILNQRYNQDSYELGGDVTRPLAGGGLKLIGLASRRDRDLNDASFNRIGSSTIGGFTQHVDDRLEETLGRMVWSRSGLSGWTVETGAEAVVNKLDSHVDLFGLGVGGVPTRIDLPSDDTTVREVRGEGFFNVSRPLSPILRLDAGLTYEQSHLTVSGDARAERTLSFWKPKATLDWRPAKWHAQLSLQRTVAQLNFQDFVSSAELTNERVNGGNPDLVPQRAWEGRLTVERPLLGDGLAKLVLGYNRVEQVQDRVPLANGLDAPGNLGTGRLWFVQPRLDVPLDRLGIKGGRVTLYASYVKSSVQDPYTLQDRRFSGNADFYAQATFRQDRGKLAWGFDLSGGSTSTFYRQTELDNFFSHVPFVTAFGEYRPDPKTTVRLDLRNLTEEPGRRRRLFFTPDRRAAAPFLEEVRVRNSHMLPTLTVKRSFG